MKSEFIYSDNYDFGMYGVEKLHPFDSKKYSRAWNLFKDSIGQNKVSETLCNKLADNSFLLRGHSNNYLASLKQSKNVAQVIEISLARFLPNQALQSKLLTPARHACYGTWLATTKAINESKFVMNFGGGYHHAFSDHGEGFCFFADAALSILHTRDQKLIAPDDDILMIDLDAHRGNGFESYFTNDSSVKNFDMYNFQTYPGMHPGDVDEFPFMVPLRAGMQGEEYLKALKDELPSFFNSSSNTKLAFYNAGTDILKGDALGGLNVDFEEVIERDRFVIEQLLQRKIPTVVMTSGGYSKHSYKLIARLAQTINELCD